MNEQTWLEEGWFFHNHAWHLLHEIIKLIPSETKSLLDVGAGTGLAAAVIKAIYPDITIRVTDISENSLSFWEDRNLIGYVTNGNPLPFVDKKFDLVMSSHVIEHLENPEKLISEMWRVCKNRLVIAVPDGDIHFYDHKIIFDRTVFLETIKSVIIGVKIKIFPIYHPHINNLIAVIDR